MKSRASSKCWQKVTNKDWRESFQELDRITALVPGKPEVVLFSFFFTSPIPFLRAYGGHIVMYSRACAVALSAISGHTKIGAPGILLLTDQFRNHLQSLPVIGHKNILWAQAESSSFCVTFVTSYSSVFTAKLFDRLFAINLLARTGVSLDRKVPLKREPWNRKKSLACL